MNSASLSPKRKLIQPGNGFSEYDLPVSIGDTFLNTLGTHRYIVLDLLGQGTFGQVVKCVCEQSKQVVAVKIVKNQPAYFNQAKIEINMLQRINQVNQTSERHVVRMLDFFQHKRHLCIVFEVLGLSLYEVLKRNKYRGLSLKLVQSFVSQILDALVLLREASIIHCDIKPENILLKSNESIEIKLIDLGSACFDNETVFQYIQSRYYRAPEVLLGYPYDHAIDMWSVGCVALELFFGMPLFPGASEFDMIIRIVEMFGLPPEDLLKTGRNARKYFAADEDGVYTRLYNVQEYENLNRQKANIGKRYFTYTQLQDLIDQYPYSTDLSFDDLSREKNSREGFLDFLQGCLDLDPKTRWSPRQARQHPFVTGDPFTGPFQPPNDSPITQSPDLSYIRNIPLHWSVPESRFFLPPPLGSYRLPQPYVQQVQQQLLQARLKQLEATTVGGLQQGPLLDQLKQKQARAIEQDLHEVQQPLRRGDLAGSGNSAGSAGMLTQLQLAQLAEGAQAPTQQISQSAGSEQAATLAAYAAAFAVLNQGQQQGQQMHSGAHSLPAYNLHSIEQFLAQQLQRQHPEQQASLAQQQSQHRQQQLLQQLEAAQSTQQQQLQQQQASALNKLQSLAGLSPASQQLAYSLSQQPPGMSSRQALTFDNRLLQPSSIQVGFQTTQQLSQQPQVSPLQGQCLPIASELVRAFRSPRKGTTGASPSGSVRVMDLCQASSNLSVIMEHQQLSQAQCTSHNTVGGGGPSGLDEGNGISPAVRQLQSLRTWNSGPPIGSEKGALRSDIGRPIITTGNQPVQSSAGQQQQPPQPLVVKTQQGGGIQVLAPSTQQAQQLAASTSFAAVPAANVPSSGTYRGFAHPLGPFADQQQLQQQPQQQLHYTPQATHIRKIVTTARQASLLAPSSPAQSSRSFGTSGAGSGLGTVPSDVSPLFREPSGSTQISPQILNLSLDCARPGAPAEQVRRKGDSGAPRLEEGQMPRLQGPAGLVLARGRSTPRKRPTSPREDGSPACYPSYEDAALQSPSSQKRAHYQAPRPAALCSTNPPDANCPSPSLPMSLGSSVPPLLRATKSDTQPTMDRSRLTIGSFGGSLLLDERTSDETLKDSSGAGGDESTQPWEQRAGALDEGAPLLGPPASGLWLSRQGQGAGDSAQSLHPCAVATAGPAVRGRQIDPAQQRNGDISDLGDSACFKSGLGNIMFPPGSGKPGASSQSGPLPCTGPGGDTDTAAPQQHGQRQISGLLSALLQQRQHASVAEQGELAHQLSCSGPGGNSFEGWLGSQDQISRAPSSQPPAPNNLELHAVQQ